MLHPNPDRQATLILSRQPSGSLTVTGKSSASLGYRYSGAGVSEGEGVWAEWNWDGHQLTVRNDRFGFLPVYYAQLSSGFGVSTSALELIRAGAATDLDDAAVAVFVRLGYYIGNDTPFKSVRLLPAGSELTWTEGTPSIRTLAPPISETVSTLSREQAVYEYGVRFQEVVEAMVPAASERMCVPLSAGRDSRHILYALVRAGRSPSMVVTARSAPPRPSTDAQIAAKITAPRARRDSVPHPGRSRGFLSIRRHDRIRRSGNERKSDRRRVRLSQRVSKRDRRLPRALQAGVLSNRRRLCAARHQHAV